MSKEMNRVIEELGQAFESFKSANEHRLKALENKTSDPLATDQVERLTGVMNNLNAKLDQLRQEAKIQSISDRPVLGENLQSADIERKAFTEYLRTGNIQPLQALETKDLNHTEGSGQSLLQDGKILLPHTLQMGVESILELHCPVMKLAKRVLHTPGMRIHEMRVDPKTFDPFLGEESQNRWQNVALEADALKISKVELKAHHFSLSEKVSMELVDGIESILLAIWSQGVGHTLNRAFLHGAENTEPKGMLVGMFSDDIDDNKCLSLKTGSANAIGTNKNIISKILDMKQSIPPQYADKLDIMAHSATIAALMKVEVEGQYPYSAIDNTFLGIKMYANNEMPQPSKDGLPHIIMANYSAFYSYLFGHISIWVDRKSHDGMPRVTAQYVGGGTPIHTEACIGLTFKA